MDESISSFRVFRWIFSFLLCFALQFLSENGVDPDQMPHSVASELGLHCSHMSPM